ncbi:MAG: NifU family protein [Alphaproteobacteria bacterium]
MSDATRHVVHDIARRGPVRARAPVATAAADDEPPMSAEERALVARVVESIRPDFQADGGDVAFVDVTGGTVRVRLFGVCAECGAAVLSLGGLQRRLAEALGRRVRVRPVPLANGRPA